MLTERFYRALTASLVGEGALRGRLFVAVGEGDPSWGGSPPAPGRGDEMRAELARVEVSPDDVVFVDENGARTEEPGTRLAVSAVFPPGRGTGTLRECGLFGVDAGEERGSGALLSYFTHRPLEKSERMELRRTVRIDLTPPVPIPGQRATRYLANTRSRELHDLAATVPECRIGEIRVDRRFYMESLEAAAELRYDFCAYCFGREASRR